MRKKTFILCLVILMFIGGCFSLKIFHRNPVVREEADVNSCAYFTGEIVEKVEEFFYVIPMEDWQWEEASRIKIPVQQIKEFDRNDWKVGDTIRVAFNSSSMEWLDDEVNIGIVFATYEGES